MADVMARPLSRPLQNASMPEDKAKQIIDLYGGEDDQPKAMARPLSRPLARSIQDGSRSFTESTKERAGEAIQPVKDIYNRVPTTPEKGESAGQFVMRAAKRDLPEGVMAPIKAVNAAYGTVMAPVAAGAETIERAGAKAAGVPPATAEKLARNTGDVAESLGMIMPGGEGIKPAEAIASAVKREGAEAIKPLAAPAPPVKALTRELSAASPTGKQSKIFSPDQPVASTKAASTVQGVADKLYQQRNAVRADYKEFSQWAKPLKGIPQKFWQKALDHLDNPKGVPLSPEEKLIFDRSIGTMKEEIDANRAQIKAAGLNPNSFDEESGSLGGAIRVRKGMNTPLDKLTGTKTAARPPEAGKSLSRAAGTFKARNMMALEQDGKRQIVHVDRDGAIHDATDPAKKLGEIDETGLPTGGGKLVDATRKEIEAATGGKIQYHDNAFGVYGTTLLQTRRALRSVQALQDIKKSPDFNLIAHGPFSKGAIPKGWREIPDSPEFRGYRFEPKYAEEIEDFLKGAKFDAGEFNKLDRLNRFSLNTMFWANPYHAFNMNNAFTVTKGLGGLTKDLPGTTADLLKAIKSVATRDKFNMEQTRAGVPMRGLDTAGEDFRKMTLDIMGVKMRQDPKGFAQFAKEFGFNKPADFYQYVSKLSHKATFSWQDILQQTLERGLMRKGMTRAQATEQIAKTFMNYRTPSRVGDQRWIGQALQGQAWLNFPKYAYGRLNGLYNILKGSSKLDPHSLDQLITIGILYEFGQHVINPWLQQITGQSNAELSEFGYEAPVGLAADLMHGKRTVGQDVQSLLSPGYMLQAADLARGVQPFLGKPISQPGESPKEVAFDYANQFADRFSPVQKANQVARGQITPDDLWLEQMGVRFPTDPQELKSVRRGLKSREKYGNPTENLFDEVIGR